MIERTEYSNKRLIETNIWVNQKTYFIVRKTIKIPKEPQ